MRLEEILTESPLGDYEVIDTTNYVTKDVKKHVKSISRVFEKVGFKVNIYFVSLPYNYLAHLPFKPKYEKDSHNSDFYIRLAKKELKTLQLPIAPPSPDEMTIIFWSNNEFELTAWSIIHDIIHALSAERASNSLLDEVECAIKDAEPVTRNVYSKKQNWRSLFTFRSARDGTLRPEEITTELMTQYLVTGDIRFNSKKLTALIPSFKKNFQKILEQGKGKMFLTGA